MVKTVQCWSDQFESLLQDCFDQVDWDMFLVAFGNNIDVYIDSVTGFIRKCIGNVIPTVTIRTYSKQKLWQHLHKSKSTNHHI